MGSKDNRSTENPLTDNADSASTSSNKPDTAVSSLLLLQEYLLPSIPPKQQSSNPEKDEELVSSNEYQPGTPPSIEDLPMVLEGILFVANEALTLDQLNNLLDKPGKNLIYQTLLDVQKSWQEEKRGMQIHQVENAWQIRSNPRISNWTQRVSESKPKRLSKAALEALAVIAYRQPVTRGEVDQIRGVDSNAVIHKLIQYQLVKTVGKRDDEPGKPEILGTTDEFLSVFNLRDLLDLPTLQDIRNISSTVFDMDSEDQEDSDQT